MQPYMAGSGESQSNALIGSIKALNCEAAHTALNDALKEGNSTGAVLSRLYEAWKAGAPDSDQLMDYYKKTLNYMPVLFYLGDKSDEGYINMGISSISEHNMMKI
jgi:hypothetical protein